MLCSRSSLLIHPFRISKSIRPRISATPLPIVRQLRGVLKMATTETNESTSNPPPLKISDLKKEAKILEDYLNLASVANVHSHQPNSKGPISFTFTYNQRKLAANGKRNVVLSSTLSDPANLDSFGPVSLPFEIQDAVIYSPAPSRRQTFLVRAGDTPESVVLEIWEGPKCSKRLQVPATLHGSVLNDGLFSGGASWSNDESKIAYVAESPPNEGLPDWGKDTEDESETKLTSKTWKGIGQWDQSWGEGLTNIKRPSIFVFDLKTCSILSFKKLLNDSSLGQPIWSPNDAGLVYVKWPHFQSNFKDVALKLGYRHCKNRPSSLHYIPLEASSDESKSDLCLSPKLSSAFIPSFSPNGKTLVFFSNEHAVEVGIHASVSRLYTIDWNQVEFKLEDENLDLAEYTKLVIGDVARPIPPLNFPGLVPLKDNPMSSPFLDNDRIILSCEWGFQAVIISIRLSTGEVTPLSPIGMINESYNLLCFKSGVIIASRSSLTSAPRLVARRVVNDAPWIELDHSLQPQVECIVQEALESLEQHEIKFQPKNYPNGFPESPVLCEAVVVRRKDAEKAQQTMLIPHGGPHSAALQGYTPLYALLCSLGVTALIINYRGSTNYGTDFIMTLPGHIGKVDVEDCMQALDESIQKGYTDKTKVCVSGGSHGGFLAGHLLGQFPDRFRCAILRNPALTLGHMIYTSDIPDWVFVETFGPRGRDLFTTLPESEILQKFYEKSATRYVEQVKSPMLFLLGALDYRVPPSDALRYISTLKSRKGHPEVRVVVFPNDRHALDSPQTEFESAMNIIWWLKKHEMIE